MADKEYPLDIVIRAVDKATEPFRKINDKIQGAIGNTKRLTDAMGRFNEAAGLPKIKKAWEGFEKSIDRVKTRATAVVTPFLAIGAAAAGAFFGIIKPATEAGDELAKTSSRLGLTANAYAELRFAADKAGVANEEFTGGLTNFVKSLGDAKAGTGKLSSFLGRVSPVLLDQVKAAGSTEEALNLMFAAIDRLDDPAKRAALASAAFGKQAGPKMALLVRDGTKSIEEQREIFRKLAGDQTKFAAESEKFDDAWKDVETAFIGVRNAGVTELLKALIPVFGSLAEMIAANREKIAKWAKDFGERLPSILTALGHAFEGLLKVAGVIVFVATLTDQFIGLDKVLGVIVGFRIFRLLLALGGLGKSIVQLVISVLPLLLTGLSALASAFYAVGVAILTTPVGWIILAVGALAIGIYRSHKAIKQFGASWSEIWRGIVDVTLQSIAFLIKPMSEMIRLLSLGKIDISGSIAGAGDKLLAGASVGAGEVRANVQAQNIQRTNNAKVQVEFNNAPRGMRVQADPSSDADLDYSMGYTMAVP